jgi:hypothetical protein
LFKRRADQPQRRPAGAPPAPVPAEAAATQDATAGAATAGAATAGAATADTATAPGIPAAPAEAAEAADGDPFAMAEELAATEAAAAVSADLSGPGAGVAFDGITEEFRLSGRMLASGSLGEILGRGQPVPITDVSWGPVDGSAPLAGAPGLRHVDPDDFLVVVAPVDGGDRLPPPAGGWSVVLDLGTLVVTGTAAPVPSGGGPGDLLGEAGDRFVLVREASVAAGDLVLTTEPVAALVNRARVRAVRTAAP